MIVMEQKKDARTVYIRSYKSAAVAYCKETENLHAKIVTLEKGRLCD